MMEGKTQFLFRRMDQWEVRLCMLCNRVEKLLWGHNLFVVASRLGDGIIWYVMIIAIALMEQNHGIQSAGHMIAVGALSTLVYKLLKKKLVRQRPYITWDQIRLGAAPLDLYSFPSGHTLHAVAFTIVVTAYYPYLAWILVPFTALVAMSRVVLGLHYPTDVLVGAIIGALLAYGSFYWIAVS